MSKISVVVNTLNEEENISRALSSVQKMADEIVVCDMYSDDKTVDIAKKFGAKICHHKRTNFVEPARNYALSKTTGDWIFILDADEEIPASLGEELKKIAKNDEVDYVLIPRKNIIFGKWMQHSRWWPDYNIRFFKKGQVSWSDKIHSVPKTFGRKIELENKEENSIVHYNYVTLTQYLERMLRYSRIQSEELIKDGYTFTWRDLIKKPFSEFLSRFFAGEGYKDGVHGLALALLQSFSQLIVYLRVWETEGFKSEETPDVLSEMKNLNKELNYWVNLKTKNPLKKILRKIKLS